jgi:hypothetical protein
MESAVEIAQRLVSVLGGLLGTELRTGYVRSALTGLGPEQVADLLTVTLSHVEARSPGHAELLQALSLALSDPGFTPLREAARAVLAGRGQAVTARMLHPAPEGEGDDEATRVPDFGTGRPITLGERKSLARRTDRDLIARVLRDPHPDVIRILLGNPGLTEQDVVRLAARRPVLGDVLREVFRAPRWVVRYRVKLTLVLNPNTPIDVALQLAPHLTRQDRQRVARSPELAEALRQTCTDGRHSILH